MCFYDTAGCQHAPLMQAATCSRRTATDSTEESQRALARTLIFRKRAQPGFLTQLRGFCTGTLTGFLE